MEQCLLQNVIKKFIMFKLFKNNTKVYVYVYYNFFFILYYIQSFKL